jgi:hypothetical protein
VIVESVDTVGIVGAAAALPAPRASAPNGTATRAAALKATARKDVRRERRGNAWVM